MSYRHSLSPIQLWGHDTWVLPTSLQFTGVSCGLGTVLGYRRHQFAFIRWLVSNSICNTYICMYIYICIEANIYRHRNTAGLKHYRGHLWHCTRAKPGRLVAGAATRRPLTLFGILFTLFHPRHSASLALVPPAPNNLYILSTRVFSNKFMELVTVKLLVVIIKY